MKQNEYDMKLAETVQNVESQKKQEIQEIQSKYAEEKSNLVDEVIQSILNERKD